jgi:hypothetical protein
MLASKTHDAPWFHFKWFFGVLGAYTIQSLISCASYHHMSTNCEMWPIEHGVQLQAPKIVSHWTQPNKIRLMF